MSWSQTSVKFSCENTKVLLAQIPKHPARPPQLLNHLLFIFKLQVRSQGRKEEEKEEGEHVDDDVDSINGEDE